MRSRNWTSGLLAAAILFCVPAFAQAPPVGAPAPRSLALPPLPGSQQQRPPQASPQQRIAYDTAFQATLDKPSDPDTLVRFAQLA
ncbi:MAG TPA: hypothetical protein VEC60_06905, partial [Reyranella sp.]|nr:hypothetical protein [Reyranella sp.]